MPVIDASLYVALINAQEENHAAGWAWFKKAIADGERFSAPVILLAEVAAALSRGVGDLLLAHQVTAQLKHSTLIELVTITPHLAEQAAAIAADHRIRGCDAVYVALAKERNDYLVTLDRQQLERGAAVIITRKP